MGKYEGQALLSIIRHDDGRRVVGLREIVGGGDAGDVLRAAVDIIMADGSIERVEPPLQPPESWMHKQGPGQD